MIGTLAVSITIAFILVLAGVAAMVLTWRRRRDGKPSEPNYRAFFMMGTMWFPVGLASMIIFLFLDVSFVVGLPLLVMGVIYLSIGLAKRDKWNKRV